VGLARTLVTGAAGFAGGHLLERLPDSAAVVAWHRPGGREPAMGGKARWMPLDLLDRAAVALAISTETPRSAFHLAGAPNVETSWRNPTPHLRVNVLGTHHLLEALRQSGHPCRLVVVSSAQVYRPDHHALPEDAPLIPPSPYGLTKLAQDQLALRAAIDDGLDVVVARPFNHVGPRQTADFALSSFARQIARIEAGLAPATLHVGNLDAARDITDVRDVVRAYIALAERGRAGRAYNVCSGQAHRVGDLLDMLRSMATVRVAIDVHRERLRPNDTPVLLGDSSRIREELGWKPVIPIERTLRDMLEWWRTTVTSEP
jgi:GDP-4-dehydro-6-deoxy-D-mannose reductase